MPYKIVHNDDGSYAVINARTGKIHAYHTSLTKAQKQIKLMQIIDADKMKHARSFKGKGLLRS